jgi:hypothetical protein
MLILMRSQEQADAGSNNQHEFAIHFVNISPAIWLA